MQLTLCASAVGSVRKIHALLEFGPGDFFMVLTNHGIAADCACTHWNGRLVSHGDKPCLGIITAFTSSGTVKASILGLVPPNPLKSDPMPPKTAHLPVTISKGMMTAHTVQSIARRAIPEGAAAWVHSMGHFPFPTLSAESV